MLMLCDRIDRNQIGLARCQRNAGRRLRDIGEPHSQISVMHAVPSILWRQVGGQ
jgi:hypothetical protein